MEQLGLILRASRPKALATLVRLLGDFDLAEEAVQEAILRAVQAWPEAGRPGNPVAWLVQTGRRHAIDRIRRQAVDRRSRQGLAPLLEPAVEAPDEADAPAVLEDDLLRLIFTCCHPALAVEAQIALTLKTVAGLGLEEVASAFLLAPRAMEQRLTRAKRKIRDARIPYEVPQEGELASRRGAVLHCVYLIFNEGYRAAQGTELARDSLAEEAIRLARLLARLFRGAPEAGGLLALLLLTHARRPARTGRDGRIVLLEAQDRRLWDRAMIAEGRTLVDKTLRAGRPGPYQVQAAIAALHAVAPSVAETDWAEIALLYAALEEMQPSPVVTLNRAVALSRADGPAAGLDLLESLAGDAAMLRYAPFHGARAALLAESGDRDAARTAYERALFLSGNQRDREHLLERLSALG
ncbi:MAG: sigma-70 family RNA polymerase sigma factor [Sneathiellaceae bacterium]